MRDVHNEYLGNRFTLPVQVGRVVSLVSSASEVMGAMALLDRLVGVSEYCGRYIDVSGAEVVGRYLDADFEAIRALEPELILMTTGVQRRLAGRLVEAGLPVYNLNLPVSWEGVLENVMLLGGLLGEMGLAREHVSRLRERAMVLRMGNEGHERVRVYLELWLGRHLRAVGGLSYIRDLVEMAGGELVYGDRADGYFVPDFEEVKGMDADVFVCFHEPEFLVDGEALVRERGWNLPVVMSVVDRGMNVIQDAGSLLETAEWLRGEFGKIGVGSGVGIGEEMYEDGGGL